MGLIAVDNCQKIFFNFLDSRHTLTNEIQADEIDKFLKKKKNDLLTEILGDNSKLDLRRNRHAATH